MRYYPILLDVHDKKCIVIGAGNVGERKVETLLQCGARVEIIGKTLSHKLNDLVDKGRINYVASEYTESHLDGALLVIGATDEPELNARIAEDAQKKGIFFNIVDRPHLCSFIVPSIITRGDLIVTFSTCGKSPALAKKLRKKYEAAFGQEYAIFLELMGKIRSKILSQSTDSLQNKRIFEQLVSSSLLEWIKGGELERIDDFLVGLLGEGYSLKKLDVTIKKNDY